MPRKYRFGRGSTNELLGILDAGGGFAKRKQMRDNSIETSLFDCIACGYHALDETGLQFHLDGSRFCFETIKGKKHRSSIAPPRTVLSPLRSWNNLYNSNFGRPGATTTSQLGVSQDRLIDCIQVDDKNDDADVSRILSSSISTSNHQEKSDQNNTARTTDNYHDIYDLHALGEDDNAFQSSVEDSTSTQVDDNDDVPDGGDDSITSIVSTSNHQDQESEQNTTARTTTDNNHHDIDASHELRDENSFPSSVEDVVHLELATICRDGYFPLNTYDHILRWAQRAHLQGYRFPVDAPSHQSFLSKVADRLDMNDVKAELVTVVLDGGGTFILPVFDFVTMFRSLLDDPRIRPYLMINWDHPNQPPKFDPRYYHEIHSGSWHSKTSAECLHQLNDVLSGLILFIDRTHVALKDRLSLCPVMFSLSIVPLWLRNYSFAWRPLGFMKKLPSSKVRGQNMTNHHRMICSVIRGMVDAQKSGGIRCTLPDPKGIEIRLTFKVALCFVVGDVEGHDVLCGRFQSHHTKRLSRECDCPTDQASNSNFECTFTSMHDIAMMRASVNKKERLQNASYHDLDSAFSNVWFGGGNPHGIHRATPSEVLHTIQKGWHEYALEGFFGVLSDGPTRFVEMIAKRLSEQLRHQSDRDLPRTSFPHGISTIAQLQAHEAAGVLLLLVLSLHCHIGWDMGREKHSFVNSRYVEEKKVLEYRTLFETLLCVEAWYKLKKVPKVDIDSGRAKAAIRVAMKQYVMTVNRQEG
jgi:hypothetical protein